MPERPTKLTETPPRQDKKTKNPGQQHIQPEYKGGKPSKGAPNSAQEETITDQNPSENQPRAIERPHQDHNSRQQPPRNDLRAPKKDLEHANN